MEEETDSGIGLGGKVVKQLTSHLKGKFHQVFIDNYTSPQLLHQLLDSDINACGTVLLNRKGYPDELKKPMLRERLGLDKLFTIFIL